MSNKKAFYWKRIRLRGNLKVNLNQSWAEPKSIERSGNSANNLFHTTKKTSAFIYKFQQNFNGKFLGAKTIRPTVRTEIINFLQNSRLEHIPGRTQHSHHPRTFHVCLYWSAVSPEPPTHPPTLRGRPLMVRGARRVRGTVSASLALCNDRKKPTYRAAKTTKKTWKRGEKGWKAVLVCKKVHAKAGRKDVERKKETVA